VIEAGNSNSNLVPVVADGEVFVASKDELEIFGLTSAAKQGQASVSHEAKQKP
jgi:hypothetical protein